jgi:signal transduction histidine kinase
VRHLRPDRLPGLPSSTRPRSRSRRPIPGDPRPVRADVRAGSETLGVLTGHLPATRAWERADQDLLDLFASEVGVALRNAELFGQIESQNARLLELDAAKDEFLRGVSHNLQTPLTSIRAYVDQLRASGRGRPPTAPPDRGRAGRPPDPARPPAADRDPARGRRAAPESEVIAMGRASGAPGRRSTPAGTAFELRDEAGGWLAVADPDQLDQVLWALLDNAVKYGGRDGKVEVEIRADDTIDRLHVTIADHGPGVSEADRERLFTRFTRGATHTSGDGTGLGLYVSRQLLRTMGGELWLESGAQGLGAAFTLSLPGRAARRRGLMRLRERRNGWTTGFLGGFGRRRARARRRLRIRHRNSRSERPSAWGPERPALQRRLQHAARIRPDLGNPRRSGGPKRTTTGEPRSEESIEGVSVDVEVLATASRSPAEIHTGQFDRLSDWINMQTGFIQVHDAWHVHLGQTAAPDPDQRKGTLWVRLNQVVLIAERAPIQQVRPGAPVVQKQRRKVSIVTPGYNLSGSIHVVAHGSMSQFLETPDPHFLPMTDLTVRWLSDATMIARFPFAMVNREQLVTVLDDSASQGGGSSGSGNVDEDMPLHQIFGAA